MYMMFNINNLAYFTEGTKLIKTGKKKSQETGGTTSLVKVLPRYQKNPELTLPPIGPFHYQTDEQSSGVVT